MAQGRQPRAEGESAEQIREMIEQGDGTEIVERTERVGELYLGGQKPEAQAARRRNSPGSSKLLARQLDVLHRGIVAPSSPRWSSSTAAWPS